VITGVSGSGKSTLARDVLHDNLGARLSASSRSRTFEWNGCKAIEGWEEVVRLLEVDQTPIGKTPRSCPATYVGFWDLIRQIYANTTEARLRGYEAGRFSFNTAGGRCEACEGQGLRKIEMSFLPDVKVLCDVCGGKRFSPETLAIEYKGKSVGDVLMMSVDEAVDFFAAHEKIHRALRLLQDVGLGYLTLGQQSPTLSGGEAQRIKLVTELAKVREGAPNVAQFALRSKTFRARAQTSSLPTAHSPQPTASPTALPRATLYVLDEPTVGLHMADVEKLIHVLHRLVHAGNTVVVVEHDLDIMAEADWIIDLGPEGGADGGKIVAQGPPEEIVKNAKNSHTARVLKQFLKERSAS
jgi:excinuclease ABC subunit A